MLRQMIGLGQDVTGRSTGMATDENIALAALDPDESTGST